MYDGRTPTVHPVKLIVKQMAVISIFIVTSPTVIGTFIWQEAHLQVVVAAYLRAVAEYGQKTHFGYVQLCQKMVRIPVSFGLWRTYIAHRPHRSALAIPVQSRLLHLELELRHIAHTVHHHYGNYRKTCRCPVKP